MYTANIQYYNIHVGAGAETQEGRASLCQPEPASLCAPICKTVLLLSSSRLQGDPKDGARARKTPRTRILSFTVLCTCESMDSFPFFFFCHDFHANSTSRNFDVPIRNSSVDLQRDPELEDGRYKMRFYFASFVRINGFLVIVSQINAVL